MKRVENKIKTLKNGQDQESKLNHITTTYQPSKCTEQPLQWFVVYFEQLEILFSAVFNFFHFNQFEGFPH